MNRMVLYKYKSEGNHDIRDGVVFSDECSAVTGADLEKHIQYRSMLDKNHVIKALELQNIPTISIGLL